jgi:large subunit ribosomal protein L13
MAKTTTITKDKVKRKWYLVDATGVRLGRLASFVARLLIGKHKEAYAPNIDCGDYVVVINAKSIDVHPKKIKDKMYRHHSGYPGGLKEMTLGEMLKRNPCTVIKKAVRGMIPKTKLGKQIFKKLFVYEGEEHIHKAQKPESIEVK